MKKLISICGSDVSDENLSKHALDIAYKVGRLIAKKDGVIICGGHGGVMESVCRGAKDEGGITVGIMPYENDEANDYIDVAIPTNIGNVRNFLVSRAGDVTIAIGGRWGTLNEISFRMITGKPIILIKGTGGSVDEIINSKILKKTDTNYFVVDSAEEAVDKAFEII